MDYIRKYLSCCIASHNENIAKDINEEHTTIQNKENISHIDVNPKQTIEIEMKKIKSPTNSDYDFNDDFNEVTNEDYDDIPPTNATDNVNATDNENAVNNDNKNDDDDVKSPTNQTQSNLFASSLSIRNYFDK